jgi:hypothetical protein
MLILRDKDVISSKRPAEYGEREEEEVRHNTSVNPAMLRHGSRVRSLRPDSYGGNSITEKGDRIIRQYITRKRQFEPITSKIVSNLKDRNSHLELLSVW